MVSIKKLIMILAGVCLAIPSVYASVVLSGTRVIYPASEEEVTIKLSNENTYPALVQSWIDKGEVARGEVQPNPDAKGQKKTNVPFLLTPPLFRLESKKSQTLRLVYTGESLPQDRESLFWLNVMDVPPIEKAPTDSAQRNLLRIAFRSSVKLFFRPKGLASKVEDAPSSVVWRWKPSEEKGVAILEGSNPTPYHITFAQVKTVVGGKEYIAEDGGMITPFSKMIFTFKNISHLPTVSTDVLYMTVNDYGGSSPGKSSAK